MQKTVKVSVVVSSSAARFGVGVRAPSIREALSLVGGKDPQREVRVVFPAEPAGLFVREPSAPAGMAGTGQAQREAA